MTNISNQSSTSVKPEYLLKVQNLVCSYSGKRKSKIPFWGKTNEQRHVVHNVFFKINPGETFALVGESGSGKTTIMRAIGGLIAPVDGKILYRENNITRRVEKRSRELTRQIQIVFQNPDSSLNPRRNIGYAVGRPYEFFHNLSGNVLKQRIDQALSAVNLDPEHARRYPAQLSKGERQRIAIARALAAEPSLMLCDEILSSLDVSVQAGIIDLLISLQKERNISYLFISHDLAVVRNMAHQVGVLYLGNMCELGTVEDVFSPPFHPYTEVLLMAIPRPIPGFKPSDFVLTSGELVTSKKKGCAFASRCPRKIGPICDEETPPWQQSNGHGILCHYSQEELSSLQRQP